MNFANIKWEENIKLKKLLKNEKEFKIQIISFEDVQVFFHFLKFCKLEFHVASNFSKFEYNNKIKIITSLDFFDHNCKRIILYNNTRVKDFIQIFFNLSYNEKLSFLNNNKINHFNNKLIIDSFKNKPLHFLLNINEISYVENYIESFDYLEILILISLIKNKKYKDLIKNIEEIDHKHNNLFKIKMKIDSLIERKIINRNFKFLISHKLLEFICKKINFDIKKL
ncbi:hypothetical protein NAPIS_ORF00267 [Vairimorpha apis BRL 01]|uniref:Uncharacterized protein n=1 Tax=Vairimorpha apis BRL 01 TaxID=1037528 RepID=T0LCW8_9MICR|nr:hypothetical protein NAPIS_ORF00267 [Vairimorpha apis BRL 01]